jgi:uncharacterized protein YndB with AHSA1/START domain
VPEAVHETVELDAQPEEVWEKLMDPRCLDEWVTAHREIAEMPELPLEAGDRFTQKLGVGPVSFKVEWEIVEAEAPELARWHGSGPGGSTAKVTYRLSNHNGGTRFVYENDYDLPGGVVGKAAKKAVSSAAGKREARKSLKRLAALFNGGG